MEKKINTQYAEEVIELLGETERAWLIDNDKSVMDFAEDELYPAATALKIERAVEEYEKELQYESIQPEINEDSDEDLMSKGLD